MNINSSIAPHGVRAVIFDISGTVMDFGSRAPAAAFVELFARHGVAISEAEAREPMGAHKRDHIAAILASPAVAARWARAHGAPPSAQTLADLYAAFAPLQVEVLDRHLDLIPGVAETAASLRARGIRIACTTGFDSGMMGALKPAAAAQGFEPDIWVTPDLVGAGRPAPWMIFHAARELGVYPPRAIVKVGDTAIDVEEARNAGTWPVAVAASGNESGLSASELAALPAALRSTHLDAARARLRSYGAQYVIDSAADLMPVIDAISERIERGERP